MAAPPLPIKVVDMPPPASPPPFYIQAKPKKSCRWTTLAFVVLLVWLSASALIVLHLGPECLFKKFSKSSDDDVLKTDALKQRSDDASENSVVDVSDPYQCHVPTVIQGYEKFKTHMQCLRVS
uniref:Uncharacterized protein n=1 Tax=Steinernema glaseri TaxID=37863 RepID=A0A1I7ZLN4_9BILA